MKKKLLSLVLAMIMVVGLIPVAGAASGSFAPTPQQGAVFSDVKTTDWFYYAVDALVRKNVISGFPDGTFRPEGTLTRAEAAVIMARLCGHFDLTSANTGYADVTSAYNWASGYIKKVADLDIMRGYDGANGKKEFGPAKHLTGEQWIKMLVSWIGLSAAAEARFGYPKGYMSVAEEIGLLSVCDPNMNYEAAITRKNACLLAYKASLLKGNVKLDTTADQQAQDLLAKLYNLFVNNRTEEIKKAVQSPEYIALAEKINKGYTYVYFPTTNKNKTGKGMALYFVDYPYFENLKGYGNMFVYYGDFYGGKRHGKGTWVAAKDKRYYWCDGNWSNDKPHGYNQIKEWNESVLDKGRTKTRTFSGNVSNGLWNGNINWNVTYSDRTSNSATMPIANGYGKINYNPERHGKYTPYGIATTEYDRYLGCPIDVSKTKWGIIGFDEVGSKTLVYLND